MTPLPLYHLWTNNGYTILVGRCEWSAQISRLAALTDISQYAINPGRRDTLLRKTRRFFPNCGQNHQQYSLRLPAEGWPGFSNASSKLKMDKPKISARLWHSESQAYKLILKLKGYRSRSSGRSFHDFLRLNTPYGQLFFKWVVHNFLFLCYIRVLLYFYCRPIYVLFIVWMYTVCILCNLFGVINDI